MLMPFRDLWKAGLLGLAVGSFASSAWAEHENAPPQAQTETIGTPFSARWPEEPYPRNVWDMQTYGDRLYLGAGNSANTGPSPNAGPTPIISFGDDGFRQETVIDEEQVAVFRVIKGRLWVPGHDSREDWSFGETYSLEREGWIKRRDIPRGLHVYDLFARGDQLIATGGSYDQPIDAWTSDDGGEFWRSAELIANPAFADAENPSGAFVRRVGGGQFGRLFEMFAIGDRLFASARAPLVRAPEVADAKASPLTATLFEWDDRGGFKPVGFDLRTMPLDRRTAMETSNLDLIPLAEDEKRLGQTPIAVRPLTTRTQTLYIAAWPHNDHQWKPIGLFVADAVDRIRRAMLPTGYLPYDMVQRGDVIYLLLNRQTDRGFEVAVARPRDDARSDWRIQCAFNASSFARSFEIHDGAFYFGLGTEIEDPHPSSENEAGWVREMSPASGEIWRVRRCGDQN
ncbi:hypothetical protein [Aquamicrobium terrae]|uniref:Exo-alpha-sialidase n=1 Tax=Aquamicrobium terrae TaxID=1324945 RepID=A0ABV2N6B0_9HYPH